MARKLTKKRQGFVKDYIESGNATMAVRENFDVKDDNSARSLGSQLLNDPKIQDALEAALPDSLLAEKHLALLNKMDNDFPDEIDVNAVKSGLDMGYKLKGKYSAEKSVNLNLNADDLGNLIKDGLAKFRT